MFTITVGRRGTHSMLTETHESRELLVGRTPENDLVLNDSTVSSTHCRLVAIEGAALVLDEGSRNGTWVNGAPVAHPTLLSLEDELVIGPYVLRVQSLLGRGTAGCQRDRRPRPGTDTQCYGLPLPVPGDC